MVIYAELNLSKAITFGGVGFLLRTHDEMLNFRVDKVTCMGDVGP